MSLFQDANFIIKYRCFYPKGTICEKKMCFLLLSEHNIDNFATYVFYSFRLDLTSLAEIQIFGRLKFYRK